MDLTSTAFLAGERIPRQYTEDGDNVSPPLRWSPPPQGTATLALLCVDPDAPRGDFTHWVAYNLPADLRHVSAAIPAETTLSNGTQQGMNDFGRTGYSGPAPPPGKPHRYFFKVFALDTALNLSVGASRAELEAATSGHVLDEAELMGMFGR